MELEKLINSTVGDILVLNDCKALPEIGKVIETPIKSIHHFGIATSSRSYTALEIEHGELEMMLLITTIDDKSEIKMFSKFDEGSFYEFIDDCPNDSEEQEGRLPSNFIINPVNRNVEDKYLAMTPFPIYGFEKIGVESIGIIPCAIGEYKYDGESDANYCTKYAWIEWYISDDPNSDDHDNYYAIYFGWEVDIIDLNIIQY